MKGSFLHLVSKYAVITIALVVAITGFFLYHALFLTLDADYTSLLAKDEMNSTYQGGVATRTPIEKPPVDEVEELDEPTEFPSSYMLLIESPTLYTAEALTSINEVLDALSESPYLASRFSLFDFVTLEKRGTRLMSVPFASSSWTDEEAALLKERVETDPMVKNYLVSEDLHGLFINFESVDLTPQMEAELQEILEPLVIISIRWIRARLRSWNRTMIKPADTFQHIAIPVCLAIFAIADNVDPDLRLLGDNIVDRLC